LQINIEDTITANVNGAILVLSPAPIKAVQDLYSGIKRMIQNKNKT
jgi:hypothetical protein